MKVDYKLGKLFDMYHILGVVRVGVNDLSTSSNLAYQGNDYSTDEQVKSNCTC